VAKRGGRVRGTRNHPIELKQRLAEAACVPGVSVSKLALEHGLNVNMVFRWRRMLRAGQLGVPHAGDTPVLFPVVVRGPRVEEPSVASLTGKPCERPEALPAGVIRLDLAKGQVSIEGRVDPEILRMVVQCLS
jgi:transposase